MEIFLLLINYGLMGAWMLIITLSTTRHKRRQGYESSLSTVSMLGLRDNIHFGISCSCWCLSAGLFFCHIFCIWNFCNNHSVCAIFCIYDFILCNVFYWYQMQPKIQNDLHNGRQRYIDQWIIKQFVFFIVSPFLPMALSMRRHNYDLFRYLNQTKNNHVKSKNKNKRTTKRRKKNKTLKNQTTGTTNNAIVMRHEKLVIWQAIIQVQ